MKSFAVAAILAVTGSAVAGTPEVIATLDFDANNPAPSFKTAGTNEGDWGPGDIFDRISFTSDYNGFGVPFGLSDDSVGGGTNSAFPDDTSGMLDGTTEDGFVFGVSDTVNGSNNNDFQIVEWSFDISNFTDLAIALDVSAMGDFEDSDEFVFSYNIDGGTQVTLFEGVAQTDIEDFAYTMADGDIVLLDDPILMGGILLDDTFQTLTAAIDGTGSTLNFRFGASTDGGSEALAFDNVVVSGIPTPGALALVGVAGFAAARRRRG